ncbi:MAG: hypothetical protein K0Q95_2653 [Bacteroidota bacterium]|jgi:hypothetical protein|nr:hypothetical protein [Bacteroidota bacterium]
MVINFASSIDFENTLYTMDYGTLATKGSLPNIVKLT